MFGHDSHSLFDSVNNLYASTSGYQLLIEYLFILTCNNIVILNNLNNGLQSYKINFTL
jgi:hypothetical protein